MTTRERWIESFSAELERRDVDPDRIRAEVDAVLRRLDGDDSAPDAALGDPVAYAEGLMISAVDGTPSRSAVLAIFCSIAFFIVFVLATIGWIDGDLGAAPWSIVGGVALLLSTAALSVSLSRSGIRSALRDSSSPRNDGRGNVASTLLLLVPWTFVGFAGLIIAIAALA